MARSPIRRRRQPDRGSATLEVAILAPVLLLIVFTIIQIALWCFARSLALGAAQEGLAATRVESGTLQAGRHRALEFLEEAGRDSLLAPEVQVRATSTEVQVQVTGRALSVLPGVSGLPVRQSANGPIERFSRP